MTKMIRPWAETVLIGATGCIRSFRGDGAYDDLDFRKVPGPEVHHIISYHIIPPPEDTVIRKETKKPPEEYLHQQNQAVEHIHQNGWKAWKVEQGYHRRSLNEVVMFRYKTIFGQKSSARKTENRLAEALLKCSISNRYTALDMPDSVKTA